MISKNLISILNTVYVELILLGRPSTATPISILDEEDKKVEFWFGTGGAGVCLSRSSLLKLRSFLKGRRFERFGLIYNNTLRRLIKYSEIFFCFFVSIEKNVTSIFSAPIFFGSSSLNDTNSMIQSITVLPQFYPKILLPQYSNESEKIEVWEMLLRDFKWSFLAQR